MHGLKIAYVATIDYSLRVFFSNRLKELLESGYDVVGISSNGPDVAALEAVGIRHISVPMTRNFNPFADLISLFRLYKVMKREGFPIVHTHTPKACLLGQLAARMAGVPVVLSTVHGFYFHENMSMSRRRFYKVAEKVAAGLSDVVFLVSDEDAKTAVTEGICPEEKIRKLGGIGVDIGRFARANVDPLIIQQAREELGIKNESPVVGFVGRLMVEKGIIELLKAGRLILDRFPDARFLFVGPTHAEKKDALTPEIAHAYGMAESCVFTGARFDLPELYSLMDVFVLPSHREGFPMTVMEASAMGLPSVVTDVRGCREAVVDGQNGLIVPLGDVPALAEAIGDLLGNPEKARRLGCAGRRIAEERFDEQRVFNIVKFEYKRLLGAKGLVATSN